MNIDAFPDNSSDSKETGESKDDFGSEIADLFTADGTKVVYGPDGQTPVRLHIGVSGTKRGLRRLGYDQLTMTYTAPIHGDAQGDVVAKTRIIATDINHDAKIYSLPAQGRQRVTIIPSEGRRFSRDFDDGDVRILGTLLKAAQYEVPFNGQFRTNPYS